MKKIIAYSCIIALSTTSLAVAIIPPHMSERILDYYVKNGEHDKAAAQRISNSTVELARSQRSLAILDHTLLKTMLTDLIIIAQLQESQQ